MGKFYNSLGDKIFDRINEILSLLISLACLYPFIYIFSVSISDYTAIGLGKVILFPIKPNFETYIKVLADNSLLRAYYNSILYTGIYTFISLFMCAMGGFVLAEKKFLLKRSVTVYLTLTMFISGGLIPTFLWYSTLGMVNTIWAIVLPGAVSAWNVFLYRTYINANIHQSLKDSVYMDGGSDMVVFIKIVIPLIKPMLATFALFAMVSMWNNYFSPLIYLADADKMPLTIILRKALIINPDDANVSFDYDLVSGADSDVIMSGWRKSRQMTLVMVTITPILVTYPFLQKYFVKGIMIGSIKG